VRRFGLAGGELPKPIVFSGGPILTMAEPRRVEALAIHGERIVWAGRLEECRTIAGRDREEHDLDGRTLMPGFVDAHCHPLMLGQTQSWVAIGPSVAPSIEGLVTVLTEHARRLPPGVPLRAFGYDYRRLAERRQPLASDLDRAAADREIYVMNVSGHGGAVNSFGLAAHGITAQTPNPAGGEIGRHPDGRPNGLLWDAACDLLTGEDGVKIRNHGPNIHLPEPRDVAGRQLAAALNQFLRAGVTTVVDAQVSRREAEAYIAARDAGDLKLRVNMMVISAFLEEALQLGLVGRLGDDRLAFSGIKLYADGALGGLTAYFPEGYAAEPHNHGVLYHEPAEFRALMQRAHGAGLQTGTHAQSPTAIGMVIDAVEAAQQDVPRPDMRHAIEHSGLATDEQIGRMKRAGMIPVTQPQHHLAFGDGVARTVGPELAQRLNPVGLYARAGIPVVLSSDAPVALPRPLEAVQAAVDRRTVGGAVLGGPELRIDVITALRGYTIGGAYRAHQEDRIGSLEPGKLADLVILAADPTSVPVSEIGAITVEQTWQGGRLQESTIPDDAARR
jgi:predicted amidohydrolase YtcJ